MIGVSISHRGGIQAVRTLEEVKLRGNNASPAFDKAHEYIMVVSRRQFEGGGTRGPNKWARLAPSTLSRKRRGGYRVKKMHRTEALVSSIINPSNPSHVYRADNDSMVVGSSLEQFAVHQRGYDGAPFRPPIDLTQRDVRNLTIIVAQHVVGSKGSHVVL